MGDVELNYGTDGLVIQVPDEVTTVIEPRYVSGLGEPRAALQQALREPIGEVAPLRQRVARGDRVAISVCDVTRPQPRQVMVEAVLAELDGIVPPQDVTVLVATGTHRGNTDDELREMLGSRILSECEVVNHDARATDELVDLGTFGADVPVWLNRRWVQADVRITTGFVEPHFFAGFSGGPKMVAPGLAGLETTLTLHDAARIGHPNATWGICVGNPVHDDVRAIAAATGVDYALDVVLNRDKQITGVFGGELLAMHARAREVATQVAMQPVPRRFDVVVTTNSGYPLDQNLYQSVKGMSAAAKVVKDGGLIVCAAQCSDGMPDHGLYTELLHAAASPDDLLDRLRSNAATQPDQWQVQVQATIQQRARVMVKADGLTDDQIRRAHLGPCADVSDAVARELERLGPDARVCVLPEGPQTIPYVSSQADASAGTDPDEGEQVT